MLKIVKIIILVLVSSLLLLFAILFANFSRFSSKQIEVAVAEEVEVNERVLEKLAQAVRFKTISYEQRDKIDSGEFLHLHQFLQQSFPLVHDNLQREVVNQYSLLYTWPGSDASLPPFLLMAHTDVVPIEEGTEDSWQQPPFSGKITSEHIWGRGTMDDKGMVIAILEAAELLLKKGFVPQRTVYFCFGHDEEIGGYQGTLAVAKLLESRGVRLEFALDEGLAVTQGIAPGIERPVALVGIAEKGCVSLQLKATVSGGHSSMPTYPSAIGILSEAISKLENNLLPASISGPTHEMFAYLGPEMARLEGFAMANLWLFEPLIISQLAQKPTTNALIRTTTATTIITAGEKDNILPVQATAVVNFRIFPGETVDSLKHAVEKTIADARVEVTIYGEDFANPSPVSDPQSRSFRVVQHSICQVFPNVVVAPGLMVGQTDGRHFASISDDIYRFAPILLLDNDAERFHGIDERLTITNYFQCIRFFYHVLQNGQTLQK